MSGQEGDKSHHKLRFYILLTTLVIAGILFLLFSNSDDSPLGLTSLTVHDLDDNVTLSTETTTLRDEEADPEQVLEELFSKEVGKNTKEVQVLLTFDRIPSVKKEAKIKEMVLRFDDLTTKINVNSDKLELSGLKEVTLKINGFVGKIDFDDQGLSLDGKARSISVNGVKLSSRGDMKISFADLNYQKLTIDEIELVDLELPAGDGTLEVPEKLKYGLEQDALKMYYFNGRLDLSRETVETSLFMEGVARGIMVKGALLNFNVR